MAGKFTYKIGAVSTVLLIAFSFPGVANPGDGEVKTDPRKTELPARSDIAVKRNAGTGLVQVTSNSAVAIESEQPFVELSIANPEIADISTISETMLYVLGKSPGNTTLMLLGENGELIQVVDIRVVPDISELSSRLVQLFPDQGIDAVTANDGIVLMGAVESEAVIKQALELASHYAPGRVSNLMTLKPVEEIGPDLDDFERRLRELLPEQQIAVEIVDGGIILTGEVDSANALEHASRLAESVAPGHVTSFLTIRETSLPLPDVNTLVSALAEILPDEGIRAHVIGDSIVLSGQVRSQEKLQQASEIAKILYGDSKISNMLTVRASSPCVVRTRKAGEVIEIEVPCRK